MSRIYLSPPDMNDEQRTLLLEAFDSNWIAPLGPFVDEFERLMAERTGVAHALALSSGTAALHLGLLTMGVGEGDRVVVSSLTFAASVNAIRYVGATPVFIDSDEASWNMDPTLLEQELAQSARDGALPRVVMPVDIFGQCADYGRIEAICDEYGVPIIEDAAEALGARYRGAPAGSFGAMSAVSFNGNKIITTSGGGMLLSNDGDAIARARYLSTQARDPGPHYQHSEVGYNYRLSNLLAAVGVGQLADLDRKVARRRAHNAAYRAAFGSIDGVQFMPEAPSCESTFWLTVVTLDPERVGKTREDVRLHLDAHNIEARPVWKPMHLQPAFCDYPVRGGEVTARLFDRGLCLPSGSGLTDDERGRVIEQTLAALAG